MMYYNSIIINDTQLPALLPNEEVDGSVYVCSRCMAVADLGVGQSGPGPPKSFVQ